MIRRIYKQIRARLEKRRLDEINRKAASLYKIGDYTDSSGILHVAIFAGGVIASYVSVRLRLWRPTTHAKGNRTFAASLSEVQTWDETKCAKPFSYRRGDRRSDKTN